MTLEPRPAEPWRPRTTPSGACFRCVGDLYLTNLIAQQGASFPEEYVRLFSCEAAGLRAVYEAAGSPEGPAGPLAAGLAAVDPTSDACFGQRVTNRAMQEGIGLDFSLPDGTPVRLELDSAVATHHVPILSTQAGGTPTEAQKAQYQVDMAHIVSVARIRSSMRTLARSSVRAWPSARRSVPRSTPGGSSAARAARSTRRSSVHTHGALP